MRELVPIAVLVALSFPAAAGDRDFNSVVHSVEKTLHVRRTHIPLFGLAKLVIRASHPAGAKQLDLAIFEDVHANRESIAALDDAVRSAMDERWIPMVRARTRGEWTAIYARLDGDNHVRMLIATVDSDEAVVVQMRVDADHLASTLDENPRYAKRYVHSADDE